MGRQRRLAITEVVSGTHRSGLGQVQPAKSWLRPVTRIAQAEAVSLCLQNVVVSTAQSSAQLRRMAAYVPPLRATVSM